MTNKRKEAGGTTEDRRKVEWRVKSPCSLPGFENTSVPELEIPLIPEFAPDQAKLCTPPS